MIVNFKFAMSIINYFTMISRGKLFSYALIAALLPVFASCIQDEEPNTECDILTVSLPEDILLRDPEINNDNIIIMVKDFVNITALAPEFTVTEGATIVPASGTVRDFTEPQVYVVTSQDGKWEKEYTVKVEGGGGLVLKYGFEHVETAKGIKGIYDIFYELDPDNPSERSMTWASGNQGYGWTMMGNDDPQSFPTFQADNGVVGKCVEMVTRATGSLGASVRKPIAAGNLFIGRFDMANAINKPLESTQFGSPFRKVPVAMSGYYKYTPGELYQQLNSAGKLEPVPGKVDECNIYAVLFETSETLQYLDGANVLTDPSIVAVAAISAEERKGAADWTQFHVPFVLREGKSIDPAKLEAGVYSLTVVMSSSVDGDYFSGAVGSTLFVDEIEITCN